MWLFLANNHYQLVIPEETMVVMRPPPDASPSWGASLAETYSLLPSGASSDRGGAWMASESGDGYTMVKWEGCPWMLLWMCT